MRHRLSVWALLLACSWSIYGMYQEAGDFWWKKIKDGYTMESCRAEVLKVTRRDFIGMAQWYHFPPVDGAAPKWLKDVVAVQVKGGVEPWIGCVPTELNPNKERQLQH